MPQYLPTNLWIYISDKQWSDAEEVLSEDTSWARSVGFVDGVTRGNQRYRFNYKSSYFHDGEYPLSTALRMNAPDSLILALLKAYENAASVTDEDGLFPVALAGNGEYSGEVLCALFPAADDDSFPAFLAELHARLMTLVTAEGNKRLLSTKNRCGSSLLHIVILRHYPLNLIRAVMLGYKNALCEANSIGLSPLHVALSSKRDDEIILFLLEESPDASESRC